MSFSHSFFHIFSFSFILKYLPIFSKPLEAVWDLAVQTVGLAAMQFDQGTP